MSGTQQTLIFDLCGTLYDSNTTFDFLDKYYYTSSKKYKLFRILSRSLPWKIFNKIIYKTLAIDLTRIIAVRKLKGLKKQELSNLASSFVKLELENKKIQIIHDLLNEALEKKERVILISASLDFIVEAVARELGIPEFHSTKLSYSGIHSICTGSISIDILGRKTKTCQDLKIEMKNTIVVTDNLSDSALVKDAAEAFIVTKSKNKQYWKRFNMVKEIYVLK